MNNKQRSKVSEKKKPSASLQSLQGGHAIIESILFLENKFVSLEELHQKSGYDEEQIREHVEKLRALYGENAHAMTVLERDKSFMLVIKKELIEELRSLYPAKVQQKLSRVLLETLAIIAYSQPITKAEIQALRGVNSENAIKLLIEQGIVQVVGKKSVVGTPNEYGTTQEFLRIFGLSSIKDLPKLQGHREATFT